MSTNDIAAAQPGRQHVGEPLHRPRRLGPTHIIFRAGGSPAVAGPRRRLGVMHDESLQARLAPESTCFGSGPANLHGLRIKSHVRDGRVVTAFQPRPEHEAFDGYLNGGVAATLLDCHSNRTAINHRMRASGARLAPATVTADLAVRYRRPIPSCEPLVLRGNVVEASGTRVVVESTLESNGHVGATGRATFATVGSDHPAFGRW